MKAILLDIEGTTTPIDFVHKTLFPFARSRMREFVQNQFDRLKVEIGQLITEHSIDAEYSHSLASSDQDSVSDYLEFLIDQDRKSPPLKSIQGKIWETGYLSGELLSEIYEDVPRNLERWKNAGLSVNIYSSGSILAQKLLFGYTARGDMTGYISSYFDTTSGQKRDPESYRNIERATGIESGSILFISDILAELDAARSVGFQTCLSVRPGNAAFDRDQTHRMIRNFDELI